MDSFWGVGGIVWSGFKDAKVKRETWCPELSAFVEQNKSSSHFCLPLSESAPSRLLGGKSGKAYNLIILS